MPKDSKGNIFINGELLYACVLFIVILLIKVELYNNLHVPLGASYHYSAAPPSL